MKTHTSAAAIHARRASLLEKREVCYQRTYTIVTTPVVFKGATVEKPRPPSPPPHPPPPPPSIKQKNYSVQPKRERSRIICVRRNIPTIEEPIEHQISQSIWPSTMHDTVVAIPKILYRKNQINSLSSLHIDRMYLHKATPPMEANALLHQEVVSASSIESGQDERETSIHPFRLKKNRGNQNHQQQRKRQRRAIARRLQKSERSTFRD